jgi:hypothetical protein
MFALDFGNTYLFKFKKLTIDMKNDEGRKKILCDSRIIMHEMFKFNFKNKLINILIPNHILNDEGHVWHHKIITHNGHLMFLSIGKINMKNETYGF